MALFFVGATLAVAVLTFAVHVSGRSMHPTVHEDDRLLVTPWGNDAIERFDLVSAVVPGFGVVVKRVVGLPGDSVRVRVRRGVPEVLVQPAGSEARHRVTSPTWEASPRDRELPCCDAEGADGPGGGRQVVPEDSYWLIGDNWGGSDDSRVFGFVGADQIDARLTFRVLPLRDLGRLENPVRLEPAD